MKKPRPKLTADPVPTFPDCAFVPNHWEWAWRVIEDALANKHAGGFLPGAGEGVVLRQLSPHVERDGDIGSRVQTLDEIGGIFQGPANRWSRTVAYFAGRVSFALGGWEPTFCAVNILRSGDDHIKHHIDLPQLTRPRAACVVLGASRPLELARLGRDPHWSEIVHGGTLYLLDGAELNHTCTHAIPTVEDLHAPRVSLCYFQIRPFSEDAPATGYDAATGQVVAVGPLDDVKRALVRENVKHPIIRDGLMRSDEEAEMEVAGIAEAWGDEYRAWKKERERLELDRFRRMVG